MTQDELAKLIENTKGHTPGPWEVGEYGGIYPEGNGPCIVSALTKSGFLPNHTTNEALCAAAPDLLAEVERQNERWEWGLGKYDKMIKLAADYRDQYKIADSKRVEYKDRIGKLEAENRRAKRIANNALYFDDSSDYGTALWEILDLPEDGEIPELEYVKEQGE